MEQPSQPDSLAGRALGELVHCGVSETLLGLFTGLAEVCDADGKRRFPDKVIAELRRAVLCRHYAGLTLELSQWLCLLARGAPGDPQAVLNACYVHEIHSRRRLEHALAEGSLQLPADARLAEGKLHCEAGDGAFVLHLHRLPLLMALLEVVVYIDPAILVLDAASAPKAVASTLQQQLYAFLAEHTQPAQQQRKCLALLRWLEERGALREGDAGITDAAVLAFWLEQAEQGDFRRYRSVADTFLYLDRALVAGRQVLAGARADAGQTEDTWLTLDEGLARWLDEELPAAETLCGLPRFLTRSAWLDCEVLLRHREALGRQPLTLLRMHTFGAHQARLLEAAKRRQPLPWAALQDDAYHAYVETLEELTAQMQQCRRACAQVLLDQESVAEALALLADIDPLALHGLAAHLEPGELPDWSGPRLNELRLQLPELARALDAARSSLKGINRAGFKGDAAAADAYSTGAAALAEVLKVVRRFIDDPAVSDANYRADLPIFREQLQRLHGSPQ